MSNILCFGDSITQGYSDVNGGWTQRLRRKLDSLYSHTYSHGITVTAHDVFNLGISGDTTAGLLSRMAGEIKPRLLNDDTIIVIAIGTNDSLYHANGNGLEVTEDQYKQNLVQLVDIAKRTTQKVLLVGLMPCDESKMQPMPWSSSGKSYSNERLKTFDGIIKDTSKMNEAIFVELYGDLIDADYSSYLFDGIHPNNAGHQQIADKVFSAIDPLLT